MRTCGAAVVAAITLVGAPGLRPGVYAQQLETLPLRAAIRVHAARNASLLEQSSRRARVPGRTCKARVCAGAAMGAGFGAVFGALITNGDRGGAAVLGAVIFSLIGAGVGYKSCGP